MRYQTTLLFGILFLPVLLSACSEKIEPGVSAEKTGPAVKAQTAVAEVSQQPLFYEAVGTLTARSVSTVSGKLMGTVKAVHVREGDFVKEDDLLVTLDQRQVTAQMSQAQAAVQEAMRGEAAAVSARESAKAGAEMAATTFQRYQQLLKENSVSRQEHDEVAARHRQAQAALSQAEAQVAAARFRVQQVEAAFSSAKVSEKDALVRAPYSGRVTAKLIEAGDMATPGTPFVTIEQEGRFCAELVLPEKHIQAVQVGMEMKVKVPALNDLEVTGVVGRIVPTADARSRSFQIKVAMPENLPDLKSGMFARVFVPVGGAGLLLVPQSALVDQGQLTGLYIVDPAGIARFRLVRTAKIYGDHVEIISGISPGQRYVSAVPADLKNGSKVEGV